MSAITGNNGTSVGYIQSIRNRALAEKAAKTAAETEPTAAESETTATAADSGELAAFKKEFAKTLDSLSGQTHLSMSSVTFNISDEAYGKMMDDPAYKEKVTGYIKGVLNSSYSHPPSQAAFTIDEKGENVDVKYSGISGANRANAILATMNTPHLRMGMTYYNNENLTSMLGLLGNSSSGYSGVSADGSSSLLDWLG